MSVNKADILQIQKYLSGELDAKAMHALEKQAQDDPFLMDALEGFQARGGNQIPNLADIKDRLDKRIQEPERRSVLMWRVLPIAAALLIALTAGLLWLKPNQTEKQFVADAPTNTAINKTNVVPQNPVIAVPSVQPGAITKQTLAYSSSTARHKTITHRPKTFNAEDTAEYTTTDYPVGVNGIVAGNVIAHRTITGIVTDPTGHILAGVKVRGGDVNTVTDKNGAFTIATDAVKDSALTIAYAGYDKKQVKLNGSDSIKVVLNESTTELAQVSVIAHVGDKPKNAGPAISWKSFRDYIKKQAFTDNGETGKVKLAFTVLADGTIDAIHVIKGNNEALNQKAIDLVMNAPAIKGDGDIRLMTLKIKFRKPS